MVTAEKWEPESPRLLSGGVSKENPTTLQLTLKCLSGKAMKKTKTNQILNNKKKTRKPTSKKTQLLLLTTDYVTIKPLLDLYLDSVARLEELLKMQSSFLKWQDFDFWLAEFLKDRGFSQESADKLAPIYVCCWFEQSRIDMFGPDPYTPPIIYPKIIKKMGLKPRPRKTAWYGVEPLPQEKDHILSTLS